MIAGFRALVPELREVPGLDFDVMPIPSIDGAATVGDITGLCISPGPPRARRRRPTSWSTPPAPTPVDRGRPRPATSSRPTRRSRSPTTSSSPTAEPLIGAVFNKSVSRMRIPPLLDTCGRARGRPSQPHLDQMFYAEPRPRPARCWASRSTLASQPILSPERADGVARLRDAAASRVADSLRTSTAGSAASRSAVRIGVGEDRAGELDLPGAGAELGERHRDRAAASGSGSRVAGGVQSTRRR